MPDLLNFAQYNSLFASLGGITVTFTPQDHSGAQTIQAIVMPPALAEELMGGAGTAVLRLWVDFQAISPRPLQGDQIMVAGRTYALGKVEAESEATGGAVLKLRSI